MAIVAVFSFCLSACNAPGPAQRAAAARIETLEAQKRILLEKLGRLESEQQRIADDAAAAEAEIDAVEREKEVLLANNPLIAASLQGASTALEGFMAAQTNQVAMSEEQALIGLLSGVYLAMNPEDAQRVVSQWSALDERQRTARMNAARLSREHDEKEAATTACREELNAVEQSIQQEEPSLAAASPGPRWQILGLVAVFSLVAASIIGVLAARGKKSSRDIDAQIVRRGEVASRLSPPATGDSDNRTVRRESGHVADNRRTPSAAPRDAGTLTLGGYDPEDRHNPEIVWHLPDGTEEKQLIGRKRGLVHLRIVNTSVSGQHAAVWREGGDIFIEDRNSSNGTVVNGTKLRSFTPIQLQNGDSIKIGDVVLRVRVA